MVPCSRGRSRNQSRCARARCQHSPSRLAALEGENERLRDDIEYQRGTLERALANVKRLEGEKRALQVQRKEAVREVGDSKGSAGAPPTVPGPSPSQSQSPSCFVGDNCAQRANLRKNKGALHIRFLYIGPLYTERLI